MIPGEDYIRILPELVLTVFGMAVMLLDPLLPARASRRTLGWLAFLGTVLAAAASAYQVFYPGPAFLGMVRVDSFSIFFHVLITLLAALVILASLEYLDVQEVHGGEFYGLVLLGAVGMVLMSSAVELVFLFIALEISSISTYVLAGLRRRVAAGAESSLKYFLLGSFATAFFLYGVALMFGATGTTSIYALAAALRAPHAPALAYVAVAFLFVGLGFKVASAPFHVWTPDVYEGAPAPVVALMSTAPKAAAFAVLLRIFFAANAPGWFWLVWASAALTMTLGNLGALVQTNLKRMLAYSSIAHAGYLLVAFAAAAGRPLAPAGGERSEAGVSAAIFYAAAYGAMNVGAFAVITHFARAGERYVTLDDYAGLGRRSPALAAVLSLFLLSLIGIPITGGFFAKFYVFTAAFQSNLVGLVLVGVINSAIAAYYYLRVLVVMYMREPREDAPLPAVPTAMTASLAACALATLWMGVLPGPVLDYASRAAMDLLR